MAQDKESILELIRKCLALSTSSNEHEAARAAEKAQELLFKYNLSMAEVQSGDNNKDTSIIESERDLTSKKNDGRWQVLLAYSISRYNFCSILFSSNRVYFIGEKLNTEVCQELFRWLALQLENLALKAHREYTGHERKPVFRRGFFQGAVTVIDRRLAVQWDELRQQSAQSTALVVRSDEAIQDFIQTKYPRARNRKIARGSYSQDGRAAGRMAGQEVSLTPTRNIGTNNNLRLK